ncbi:PaaX-like protein C-terminal domain-containing protein [Geodermatophilus pulveris]|uniref:PaaX-like protein C-terminal domain-containing protein n=1 Tax=Geodermatophilus pulveris TaxID=1564159 RepID=A0A239FT61_9ACTN|nr:hypothetical protein [Geodermatophilus pulveris]SNS60005.1 PaaX-like protein C-terminal domain-containing protein [Geodermatophilus pulveris]
MHRRAARLEERLGPRDGLWRMVVYTVPETECPARERVRRALTRHGFGPLGPAAWVSPHRCALDEVRHELAGEPLGRLDRLTARVVGDAVGSDAELAARGWDLPVLAAASPRETDRLGAVLAAPPPDGATALRTHLRGLAAVRRVTAGDPLLPEGLRPAGRPARAGAARGRGRGGRPAARARPGARHRRPGPDRARPAVGAPPADPGRHGHRAV